MWGRSLARTEWNSQAPSCLLDLWFPEGTDKLEGVIFHSLIHFPTIRL